ncbi:MAG: hypothetical protein ACI96G_001398, partial [Flavobacterium sp.]
TKKNKSELGVISLRKDENSTDSNHSQVDLEIYNLHLNQIIYSQLVISIDSSTKHKSVRESKKSNSYFKIFLYAEVQTN